MLALIGIFSYNFTVTFPLFTKDSLHRSTNVFTVIFSVYGVGALVSALLVAKKSLVKIQHIIYGATGFGISLIFLSLSPNLWIALVASLAVGMTSIIFITASTTFLQVTADPEVRGRVLSLQMVLTIGSVPIGGIIMGWLADHHGGRIPLVIGGIAALLAAAVGKVLA
jgi:MFS family permease